MLRHVLGDVNAVAGARAMMAVVEEEAEHGDDHDRAAENEGENGIAAAAVAGTVGHFAYSPRCPPKNEPRGAPVPRFAFANVKAKRLSRGRESGMRSPLPCGNVPSNRRGPHPSVVMAGPVSGPSMNIASADALHDRALTVPPRVPRLGSSRGC